MIYMYPHSEVNFKLSIKVMHAHAQTPVIHSATEDGFGRKLIYMYTHSEDNLSSHAHA